MVLIQFFADEASELQTKWLPEGVLFVLEAQDHQPSQITIVLPKRLATRIADTIHSRTGDPSRNCPHCQRPI
jgi:hypothetical protein